MSDVDWAERHEDDRAYGSRLGGSDSGMVAARKKRLRLTRMYRHKTIAWLSKQLGVSEKTVGRYAVELGVRLQDFDPESIADQLRAGLISKREAARLEKEVATNA